jgi:hypothetical protein
MVLQAVNILPLGGMLEDVVIDENRVLFSPAEEEQDQPKNETTEDD